MKEYGFITEKFEDGTSQRTLVTGDGKATFSDVLYRSGEVGIAIAYGSGEGLDTVTKHKEGTTVTDLDIDLVIKFEKQESIDAMIRKLVEIKEKLTIDVKE